MMKTYVAILLAATILWIPAVFAGPYVFPINPSSPEWSSLTIEERFEAMQVPEDTLAAMTTEDIHLTFLAMPVTTFYYLSSKSPQDGFDRYIRAQFNVIDALLSREDVAEVLTAYYLTYLVDETILHDYDYNWNRSVTELILCQYEVIAVMIPAEKLAVVEKAYDVIELEMSQPDNLLIDDNTIVLLGRIMQVDEFPPLMERIAYDPDVGMCLGGLVGHPAVIEYVPAYIDFVTAIAIDDNEAPVGIVLHPAAPNPFNPTTTISFTISETAPVNLSVYSITGQKVVTLVDGVTPSGTHSLVFDGSSLPSGSYVIKLETNDSIQTRKIMLVK